MRITSRMTSLFAALPFVLELSHAVAPQDMGKRAPMEFVGIEKNQEGFGSEAVAADEWQASFAPPSQLGKKNATVNQLNDRSLELGMSLVERQSCDAGYGYCSAFGRCCPSTSNCCGYGYCINPSDTCCPDGPCDPGWNCCGANCSPVGGDCCLDDNYCDPGNICVKLASSGRIVCCTDLSCTAAVVSGSTSYVTSTTPRPDPPSITPPPPLTTPIATIVDTYTTWYWTVTWWYLSYYWTFRSESTVTYTRVYQTTTFTTEASDEAEAESLFEALSATLTFEAPTEAQTSLASLVGAASRGSAEASFGEATFEVGGGTTRGTTRATRATSATTRAASATSGRGAGEPTGTVGAGGADGVRVKVGLGVVGGLSALLMVVL